QENARAVNRQPGDGVAEGEVRRVVDGDHERAVRGGDAKYFGHGYRVARGEARRAARGNDDGTGQSKETREGHPRDPAGERAHEMVWVGGGGLTVVAPDVAAVDEGHPRVPLQRLLVLGADVRLPGAPAGVETTPGGTNEREGRLGQDGDGEGSIGGQIA